jgi:hypothetical protein
VRLEERRLARAAGVVGASVASLELQHDEFAARIATLEERVGEDEPRRIVVRVGVDVGVQIVDRARARDLAGQPARELVDQLRRIFV